MLRWLKKKFDPNVANQSSSQVIDEDEVGCEVEEETFLGGSLKEESKNLNESKGERKLIWGGLGVCEVRDEHMFEGLLYKVKDGAKVDGGTEITKGTGKEGRDNDKLQYDVEKSLIQEKQLVDRGGGEDREFQDRKVSYGEEEGACEKKVEKDIEVGQTTVPKLECMSRKEECVDSYEISPKCQRGVEENLRDIAVKHEEIVKDLSGVVSKDEEIDQEIPRSSEDEEILSFSASEEAAIAVESSQSITFMFGKMTEESMKRISSEDEEMARKYQRKHLSEHGEIPEEILTDSRHIGSTEEDGSCATFEREKITQEYLNGTLKGGSTKEERLDGVTSGNEKIDSETLTDISRYVGSVEESQCCNTSEQEGIAQGYSNDTLKDEDTKEERLVGITSEKEQIDKEVLQNVTSEHEHAFTDAFKGVAAKFEQRLGSLVSVHKNITKQECKSPVPIHCTYEDLLEVAANGMESDTAHVIISNPLEMGSTEEIIESSEIEVRVEQEEKDIVMVKSEALEIGNDSPEDNIRSVHMSLLESEQLFAGTPCNQCKSGEVTEKEEPKGNSVEVERNIERTEGVPSRNIKYEEVAQKGSEVCGKKSLVCEEKQKFEKVQERQLDECKDIKNKECEETTKEVKEGCAEKSTTVEEKGNLALIKDEQLKDCTSLENIKYEDVMERNEECLEKSHIYEDKECFEGIDDGELKDCNTFGNIKHEVAVKVDVDFESKAGSGTPSLEAYEKAPSNFLTFSKIPLDLHSVVVLYPSHFNTNKINVVKPGQANNVHKLHMANSCVGLVNRSDVPHFLHSPTLEKGILSTYQMYPSFEQGIPESQHGAMPPRPLGTTLFNQLGIICNVLDRKYIQTKVFGQLIIVEIRTAFIHLVPEIEYHTWDAKKTLGGIPQAQLDSTHGLEKPQLQKLKSKREVIRIADAPEGAVVMFDAVVDMSQDDAGGFEAIAVWQGYKPAQTVSPLNSSYIVLKSQEGCQAEIQAVHKAWTVIAVEFEGDTIEVRVRNSVILYEGKCIEKATLRRLKKQGIMFKANVYLLCRADNTQQYLSTCVWYKGKPPQDVSLDFNTCYDLESEGKEKQGQHQKLVMDYPAQISRGSGDKEALLSFVDEFGIFVKIPLPDAFLDIFSEKYRRKEMAVWIHFRRIFSTNKTQEVVSIQTAPDKMLVLPITLKCPLPGCQLDNETVIKKRKNQVFEATDDSSDEERLGLENISTRMVDMYDEAVKGSDSLVATDSSREREEEILGGICDTTRSQTPRVSSSAAAVLPAAPNTHSVSLVTPSVAVSPPLLQVAPIPVTYSSSPSTQANYAASKLVHNVAVQPFTPPSVVLASSFSEAVRPVVTDAPLPLASSSPRADRLASSDHSSLSSVKQCPLGRNQPLGLQSAVLVNQKAILKYHDESRLVLESDSETEPFLIELKGQEHVVLHEKLIDITVCESGSIVHCDAHWTGHEYEPILLWQGPKPCIVAHQGELLFFDVSALIISSFESYLVLQVQDGHHSEEFKVNLEKKKVLIRGGKLQSVVDPGRWALVHLKKKAKDGKFDWFLMLLTIDDNCVDRQCMDPAFVAFMFAEDYSLASSFVNKVNFGNQSKIKISASVEEIHLAKISQENRNLLAQESSISDDEHTEKQELRNQCFLSGTISFRSKQFGTLQCQDGHVVLFFIGRLFIGDERISSSGDLTRLPLSLLKEAKAIALPTSHYEDFGITHEALITYIGVPTFINNLQSVMDVVHLNPSPKEKEVLKILGDISEEKISLLGSGVKEDEQQIFQSYSGTFEDLNMEKVKFMFSCDGKRKEIYVAKNCLYPKVELSDLSICGVLICRQTSLPLVGWLHIHKVFEKHTLEVLKGFSATSYDEGCKMIALCNEETTIVCECRTDVIHMGKTYKSIGNGSDIVDKHMHFIAETHMVNELGCRSTGYVVLFISSNIYLTKTMHEVMMNTHKCKNCWKEIPSQFGEMKAQEYIKLNLERGLTEKYRSQTSKVSCNIACDCQVDVTTGQSLVKEELAIKVPKYIAMLDYPDLDMSHIDEEWNNLVREVNSCSSGTTFCFHGTRDMTSYGTKWKAGNFKKCFANGWYLVDCLQDDTTILINRDQIYTNSQLCFQQNNPESVHTLVLLYEIITAKKMQNQTINGYTVGAWMDSKTADVPFHSCPDHQPTHISVWPYEQEPDLLISEIIMVEAKGIVGAPSTYIFGCSGHMVSIRTSVLQCGTLSLELANRRLLCTITSSSLVNGEQFDDLVGKECYSIVKAVTANTGNLVERNYKALKVWGIKSSNSYMKSDRGGACCSSAIRFCVDQVINRFKYIIAHGSVIGYQKAFHRSATTPETLLLVELSLPGRGRKVKVSCSGNRVVGIAMQDARKLSDCCFLLPKELFLFIAKERQTAYEKTYHEIHDFPRKRQGTEEIAGDRESTMQIVDFEMETRDTKETYSREDRKFASDEDVYRIDEESRFTDVRNSSKLNLSRGEREEFLKELDDVEKKKQSSEDKYNECRWKARTIGNRSVDVCMNGNDIVFEDCVVALWPKGLSHVYMRLCHVHGIIPPQPEERLPGGQIVKKDIVEIDRTAKEVLRKNEDDALEEEVEMFGGKVETGRIGGAISDKVKYKVIPYIGNRRNMQNTEDDINTSDTDDGDYCGSTDLDNRSSMNELLHSNVEHTGSSSEKDESDLENEIIKAGFSKKDISLSRMLEKQLMTENESSDQLTGVSGSLASYSNLSDVSSESARQGSDIYGGIYPPNLKGQAKMQSKCRDLSSSENSGHSQESEVFYKTCAHVQSDASQAVVSFTKDGVKQFVRIFKKVFLSGDEKLSRKSSLSKVINIDRPVGVYIVQIERIVVLWEYKITYEAVVAFVGKKPSKCDAIVKDYVSNKILLDSSKRLESKTDDDEGVKSKSEKLKPHGIAQKSLKRMQKQGAIVLKPQGNSTIHVTGKVQSHSFAYAFIETKKKNVILFWHSCTDPEAKHLSDFLTKSGGTVKAEVIPLTEEFQVFGINVTYVAVLVWYDKSPKQKSALVQESLDSFPWIITSWDPLYIQPQVMCKPSLVKEVKSGHVTYHSNRFVILQCRDRKENTIYISFKEEAIHPFFAETYCEYTKTVRISLNKVVKLFGKDWYCVSEDTEPQVCNGIYVSEKALQVWPSTLQVREPVEILSAEHQTFCIVSCRILYTNDDFGVARLKKKGLALFFRTGCDSSCQSVLKDECDLQSGVVKLTTPVKVQNDVVQWLVLKIWDGKVTDKLIQQMGVSLDVLPWRIWSWNPLLLTRSWKPSSGSTDIAHLKDHSISPHAGVVSASPLRPSPLKTSAISKPAESPELKSGKDSIFHTSGTIIKVMKSSAVLECRKKGIGNILVHCKKGDFCVDKEAPQSHNFERWLEPYLSLKFNCLAKQVKPVDVGGTEISYVSTRVWAKTSRSSESVPMLNKTSRCSSTLSIGAESNKEYTSSEVVRKKKEVSSGSKKSDISVWKQEFKHMLKGKVKEVHSTVCLVVGEDGEHKYYVSSSQCFLFGICLSCVELWHVLHTGLCVYYELHKGSHNDKIKHVWIGGMGNKSPSETRQEVLKWCSENMVSVQTKDLMLLQLGYIDPMLAPVAMDSEEEVEMAIGDIDFGDYWKSSSSDTSW